MRADQDVHPALGEGVERRPRLLWRAKARDHRDLEGVVAQPLGEGSEVLLGEHRGGHEEHHLLAVLGRLEGRPQGDLRLAVAHVPADQAIHRARLLHVGAHGLDRLELVGRLAVGEAALELELPLGVAREGVPGAAAALGVEVDQLAGQRLRGPAGAQLLLLPLLAAELGERRLAGVGSHVAADLVELVAGDEDAVAVPVLELEVVAGDAPDGLGLKTREERDAVVLVDDRRARAQVCEGGDRARSRALGTAALAAAQEAMLRHDRQLELRSHEAVAQGRVREQHRGIDRRGLTVEESCLQASQVELGALALAATPPGDDGAVARAHELLQLGLGVAQRARRGVGALGTKLVRLVLGDARQPQRGALIERRGQALG